MCLPLLIFIFLASMDACALVFANQSIEIAASEGGRVAASTSVTTEQVRKICLDMLARRGIETAVVETTPDEVAAAAEGDLITVTVTTPCDDLKLFLRFLCQGQHSSASFAMMKET